jgi:uncharacterized protein (TIGR03435 family)
LKIAYRRPLPHQIDGGPHWIDSEYFDVEGTFPPDTPFDDYALMLQTLLRDRFKLSATVVTKELSAEALVVRRSDRQLGSRLRSSNVDCASVDLSKTITTRPGEPRLCALVTGPARSQAGFRIVTMYGRSVGMPRLADYLSGARQKPVVDQTALAGIFDFDLEFLSESGAAGIQPTKNTPRLPIAVEQQLGLALRATRAPIEVLQIERVEPPTPN